MKECDRSRPPRAMPPTRAREEKGDGCGDRSNELGVPLFDSMGNLVELRNHIHVDQHVDLVATLVEAVLVHEAGGGRAENRTELQHTTHTQRKKKARRGM